MKNWIEVIADKNNKSIIEIEKDLCPYKCDKTDKCSLRNIEQI